MLDLTKKLINARSTPEKGELAAAEVIAAYVRGLGFECDIDTWDKTRANIIVRFKSAGRKPALAFASHLDVVPTGTARWKHPPFEAVEAEGKVFGRGATDMKGGIAAAIIAMCEAVQSGMELKGDIIFVGTAGEETDSCGAKRFMDSYKFPNLAGIIITEPTDLAVVNAHRGILWLKITTTGKTAHGSMPHLGINAIESARLLLNELANYKLAFTPHPQLGNSIMSVNTISGGKATNVIPDECSITVDIRTLPGQDHTEVAAGFEQLIAKLKKENPRFAAQLSIIRDCSALETAPDCEFVKTVCQIRGVNLPGTVRYTTDGPHFAVCGAPVIILGPGKPEMCHKPDEYIEIADIEKAVEYYKAIIQELLG